LDPKTSEAYRSLAYVRSVEKLIKQMNSAKHDAARMGGVAMVIDRTGTRIDQLPVVGVDSTLLEFAAKTATQLHQISESMRESLQQAAVTATSIFPQVTGVHYHRWVPYGSYGYSIYGRGRPLGRYGYGQSATYFNYRNVQAERMAVMARGTAAAGQAEHQTLAQIDIDLAKIRHELSTKYNMEF
jgi:hypothetical protein